MLRLKGITKNYRVADTVVKALKGIDISFRANEFVSILGPSGCGKTTLLNLVGGLDSYTSGNLFINGRSTSEFKDRDWDVYRNHRVGFIFQSYNLIPHQTVLGNVELALTIAGLSKAERVERAKKALDKVGLTEQYYKKPNQLSGGQCQRVAIARALVNDPEILLADEPTGALDTETSVQIMELIKEIAQERLVLMVTHNPELAEQYSTRIVRLLDGNILSDSNPYAENDEIADTAERIKVTNDEKTKLIADAQAEATKTGSKPKKIVNKESAKMSFITAFKLSLQNLFSKKARSIMTSIAGSIGIIGVSLVLSLSYGVQSYIKNMQNDMLSGNPIQVSQTAYDMSMMTSSMGGREKREVAKKIAGHVNVDSLIEQLIEQTENIDNMIVSNDIDQTYIDFINGIPKEHLGALTFDYGIDITNNLFTDFKESGTSANQNISLATLRQIYTSILLKTDYKDYATLITSLEDVFMQAPTNEDYILSQYKILSGKVATGKNEIMIVLNNDDMLTDLLLAQLGYYTQEEFTNMIYKAGNSPDFDPSLAKNSFSYTELLSREFVWYPNDALFNEPTGQMYPLQKPYTYNGYYDSSFTGGETLKVVGILTPQTGLNYGTLSSGFYYTEALTKHIIDTNKESKVVKHLQQFEELGGQFVGMKQEINDNDGTPTGLYIDLGVTFQYSYTYEGDTYANQTAYLGNANATLGMMSRFMGGDSSGRAELRTLSLQELGGSNMPSVISIYPLDFEHKTIVLAYLDKWESDATLTINGKAVTAEQRQSITYTDNLSIIISMITSMVNIITIALVGFTALSLVVSTVMIAIITYVSVMERVKEIGVIRSLGGRKKDVSYLFIAETFILGFTSGAIGILFTYFASLIINLIVKPIISISIAIFPIHYAIIMMVISIVLTLASGLMPALSAAKKDPVVALRTE